MSPPEYQPDEDYPEDWPTEPFEDYREGIAGYDATLYLEDTTWESESFNYDRNYCDEG